MSLSFRFGTVGSPIETPKKPGGSVGAIQFSKSLGLEAFELGWVQSVRVSPETCALIHQEAGAQGVALSVHAPYFINLNDDDEWPKSRKRLMDAAHYGNLAGATDIIFHPGSYFQREPEEVLGIAIPRLGACTEELRGTGNPVTLRPETMGKSALLGSFEDTLRMSREIPGVQPCVDFAHLHARPGDGSINSYDEWSRLLERYGGILGAGSLKGLHVHLSGIEYGPKGEKNHLPVRESDLDLDALFRALREFDCGGRILCESPAMEADALVMKEAWTKISGGL
jgi:deoxyribonuclease-4